MIKRSFAKGVNYMSGRFCVDLATFLNALRGAIERGELEQQEHLIHDFEFSDNGVYPKRDPIKRGPVAWYKQASNY